MIFVSCRFFALALAFVTLAHAVADTDEYRDADNGQASYFDNHNIDPAVVDSSQFGLLWQVPFNNKEKFYAKPLLFTPNDGKQLIFLASSQNYIRTLDAATGNVLNSRQVQTPFLQSDIPCTDIPDTIGIIGTPVIDPATEIAYFYAKTYIPNYRTQGNTGVINGVYYFYAVNIGDLSDVAGYPLLVDGTAADNDPRKVFIGGTILQRPSLLQVGSMIYGAFGGHCDLYNYTGTVLGIDISKPPQVVTNFAVEAGPNSAFTTDWAQNAGGGQGGIWQAGMSLASDGNRLFFATGNGVGGENQGLPASGQSGCRTLGEAVINLGIDTSTGKLTLVDYFQPYDYVNMDGGDQDFGSGGVALLDPTVFNGTGVARMAITTGKNGKIYFMNADNLGGYKQGTGQTDGIVQTIVTNQAVFGGVGTYPLEGGYVYSTPVGEPTSVYKLGFNTAGGPIFSLVGQTAENSAGRVGPGIPTITTYKGRAGTAIMWLTDPDAGLRAWYAVPQPDQTMTRIDLPQIGGVNKFQRPAFGDGKVYTTDANGVLYCLGAPVNLPLNCTSPVDFGSVTLGSNKTETLTCTALIAINRINSITTGDMNFVVDASTVPDGAITASSTFSFNVEWDLKNVTVKPAVNASYGNTTPGVKSTALTISTTNGVGGYTDSFPLSLTGTEVSNAAFLSVTPQTVDFGGLVLGLDGEVPTSTLSFTISNLGQTAMKILGYAYTEDDGDDGDVDYTNVTYSDEDQIWDLGQGFTAPYLPSINQTIAAGGQTSIQATFNASNGTGDYLSYFNVWSEGGTAEIILEGAASTKPIANFSLSNGEGGWLPGTDLLMDFGTASPGETVIQEIRICNEGGSVLTITKSKPPLGDIRAENYGIDLHETQQIAVNDCAYGSVVFNPSPEPPNVADFTMTASWTLNTDDIDFGVHVVDMTGVVHDTVVGPTYPNGSALFHYLGCYLDSGAGTRLLPQEPYADVANNTNGECQAACTSAGYVFAGTEYHQECYCGNTLPSAQWYYPESDSHCTFACPGDSNQACGGDGGYISIYYDSSKYTIDNSTFNATATTADRNVGGPQTINATGPYVYVGCYSEGSNGRALSGQAVGAPSTGGSVEYCESQCGALNYQYFGVEYANECYCGDVINAGSTLQSTSSGDSVSAGCNMVCGGNSSEYCGGPNRLNLYMLNGTDPTATSTSSAVPSSAVPSSTVPSSFVPSSFVPSSFVPSSFVPSSTIAVFSNSTMQPSSTGTVLPSQTPLSCPASNNTIYQTPNNAYLIECSIDHQGGDLTSDTVNNLEGCIAVCDSTAGCVDVSLAGGYACYLKSTLGPAVSDDGIMGAKLIQTSSSATLTTGTFTIPAVSSPAISTSSVSFMTFGANSSTSVAFTSSSAQSTTSPSAISPVRPVQSPPVCPASNSSTYIASAGSAWMVECSVDHQGGDMGSATVTGDNAFQECIEACANTTGCVDVSLSGSACYMKKTLGNALTANGILGARLILSAAESSSLSASQTAAPTPSSTHMTLSTITRSSTLASSTSTTPSVVPTAPPMIGNYTYLGCYNDSSSARALRSTGFYGSNTNNMTLDKCGAFCSQYAYWGVEYSQECYCGTDLLSNSQNQTASSCKTPCPGNSTELCGDGNRLNLYYYNATAASALPLASTSSSVSLTASSSSVAAS